MLMSEESVSFLIFSVSATQILPSSIWCTPCYCREHNLLNHCAETDLRSSPTPTPSALTVSSTRPVNWRHSSSFCLFPSARGSVPEKVSLGWNCTYSSPILCTDSTWVVHFWNFPRIRNFETHLPWDVAQFRFSVWSRKRSWTNFALDKSTVDNNQLSIDRLDSFWIFLKLFLHKLMQRHCRLRPLTPPRFLLSRRH